MEANELMKSDGSWSLCQFLVDMPGSFKPMSLSRNSGSKSGTDGPLSTLDSQ
jgi:hypothetical protein